MRFLLPLVSIVGTEIKAQFAAKHGCHVLHAVAQPAWRLPVDGQERTLLSKSRGKCSVRFGMIGVQHLPMP
jgi:hypothetical protein